MWHLLLPQTKTDFHGILRLLCQSLQPTLTYIYTNNAKIMLPGMSSGLKKSSPFFFCCIRKCLLCSWEFVWIPFGRLAFGNDTGLVIVDFVQKVCLFSFGTPDLYGKFHSRDYRYKNVMQQLNQNFQNQNEIVFKCFPMVFE